jgi:hypothetical protein
MVWQQPPAKRVQLMMKMKRLNNSVTLANAIRVPQKREASLAAEAIEQTALMPKKAGMCAV